jgi:hypothetical protein
LPLSKPQPDRRKARASNFPSWKEKIKCDEKTLRAVRAELKDLMKHRRKFAVEIRLHEICILQLQSAITRTKHAMAPSPDKVRRYKRVERILKMMLEA